MTFTGKFVFLFLLSWLYSGLGLLLLLSLSLYCTYMCDVYVTGHWAVEAAHKYIIVFLLLLIVGIFFPFLFTQV